MNMRIDSVKYGRNDPCPCFSGKKVKKCCGRAMPEGHEVGAVVRINGNPDAPEVGAIEGKTIVKVQMPIGTHGMVEPVAMVYDRQRTPMFTRFVPVAEVAELFLEGAELPDDPAEREKAMIVSPKVYAYAEIKFGQLVFSGRAPAQGW